MTDPDTTTAVPATVTATTTPQQRVAAVVAAIKGLEPGDISAAYRLDDVELAKGNKYIDGLTSGIVRVARKWDAGKAIEVIWRRVLGDIVRNASRIDGAGGR
jgi:hypothetical protein